MAHGMTKTRYFVTYGWDEIKLNPETSQYEYWEYNNEERKLLFLYTIEEHHGYDEPPFLGDFEYLATIEVDK